jgi:choice-of-anchor B domain-containing protein
MLKIKLLGILICLSIMPFNSYSQLNIDSLGHLNLNVLHDQNLNDIWGYVDENGNEYALVGGTKGTSVVDISDPTNPTELFYEPGMESVWRDVKTWGDYAYVTTEAANGLLIIDLSPLPGSAALTTTLYTGPTGSEWQAAHNLYIDSAGFCYIFGANRGNGGVIILDLNLNPMNPTEVGVFDNWYVHDGFALHDTLYLGHIYEGFFSIVDVQDRANPVLLGTAPTPSLFSHNVWTDGQYAFSTDEVSGGYIGAFDISDPMNIVELDRIQSSPGAGVIPHNTHVYQNYVVTSYYSDGVTVHDVTHPYNMVEVGNFDTYPLQTNGFHGCWGVYPYFPSGNMVASDMTQGLFVLGPNYTQACYLEGLVTDASTLLPVNQVDVQITGSNQMESTDGVGFYATGIVGGGVYDVTYSKVGYYPQTIQVNLTTGVITNQDVQLVPIPPFNLTVNVLDANTSNPIDAADVRLIASLIAHDGVSNGIGQETFTLFYQENYLIHVGKWGYITSCTDQLIDDNTGTITIYLDTGYYDDFSFDFGWTTSGDATNGHFERGIPFGTTSGSNPGWDSDDCGEYAYITGNAPNSDPDYDDIREGSVILRSPVMDLTGYADPYLNFQRWFYNEYGPLPPPDDTLICYVSNGIINDVLIDSIGYDPSSFFQWHQVTKRISDYIPITSTMQFVFRTSDYDPGINITEAGIDNFYIAEATLLDLDGINYDYSVHPNPFNNEIRVEGIINDQFVLMTSSGQIVRQGTLEQSEILINTSNVPQGFYILQVGQKIFKLIKTN